MEDNFKIFRENLSQLKNQISELNEKEEISTMEQKLLLIQETIHKTIEICKKLREKPKLKSKINEQKTFTSIQTLNKIFKLDNSSDVHSIIELSDSRIATGGGYNYSIRIFSLDLESKSWKLNIVHKAHNDIIPSLCELQGNRLVSSSVDSTIKIWNLSQDSLTLIKTLNGRGGWIYKVIPLTNNLLASGSGERIIKIWESKDNYNEVRTLVDNFSVFSLLQLQNREILVCGGDSDEISFWNINTYKKEHSIRCGGADSPNGMVELPNNCISCGKCVKVCPQKIVVFEKMNKIDSII